MTSDRDRDEGISALRGILYGLAFSAAGWAIGVGIAVLIMEVA